MDGLITMGGMRNEFAAMLMTLTFFASRELAESFWAETQNPNLEELATKLRRLFPDALLEDAQLGRLIHTVLMEAENAEEAPRVKTGRNEPCPCGSGRKYKKCCGSQ